MADDEKKNKSAGQPPIYSSPEELRSRIEEYMNGGARTRTFVTGKGEFKETVTVPVISITGLALFLGFASRQSFYDYEKRDEFSYIIKKARLFIEREYEESLQYGNTTGAIFALKNMGWDDKQQLDHTTNGESIKDNVDLSRLTTEELKTYYAIQSKLE